MGMEQWFRIPEYHLWTWQTWLVYTLCGTAGLLVRLSVTRAPIRWPRRLPSGALYLNTIGEWVTAVAVATLADHNVLFATIAAVGASSIVQVVMKSVPVATRRALGIPEPGEREA